MAWQLQEAKQRFSELVRRAQEEGPQAVTRHGEEVVVVLDSEYYRRLVGHTKDLRTQLLEGPRSEEFADLLDEAHDSYPAPTSDPVADLVDELATTPPSS